MVFLFWICETYFQPRRKRSKKKTVSQYWRDFKMLYRRLNEGRVVNANDCEEIQKVGGIISRRLCCNVRFKLTSSSTSMET